jgi:ubiquitin carboxyl-terminal hydrolase 4/11/15
MDPDQSDVKDVEMAGVSQTSGSGNNSATGLSREMSIDSPGGPDERGLGTSPGNGSIYLLLDKLQLHAELTANTVIPSLKERVKTIQTLLEAAADTPLKEGDEVYLVSRTWVKKAHASSGDSKQSKEETDSEGSLGPVDNSDIIEEVLQEPDGRRFVRLKPEASYPDSFELFTEDAWKMVNDWYGIKEGQEPIIRTAINTALDPQSEPNVMYEFNPPIFRVHRLWSELSPLPIEQSLKAANPPPLVLARSRKYHAQTFLKELKQAAGISLDNKVRLWSVPRKQPSGPSITSAVRPALTPPDSPGRAEDALNPQDSWSTLLLDVATFSQVRDDKVAVGMPDHTGNSNYNGKSPLQMNNLVTDQTLVLDEAIGSDWVLTFNGRSRNSPRAIPTRANVSAAVSKPSSGRNSPAPSGAITRGRGQKRSLRSVGSVGLHNLGNTCYMNSALQCFRSVEELTKYFLTDAYLEEINRGNPLGYNGRVASAYGNLVREIYEEGRGSVSPREFKTTVGRCRSTFSGWGQQDSQEFLGFLLDALQEDLSRIEKKPYIEKPDSTDDMINNPDAIREMAEKVWDITRKRDDSVIADLFTGMYKSTLKCPECGKISITFDPFNNLTLPLPVEDLMSRTIKFYPLNDSPVKIEVELPKHSSIESLKQFVSVRTGVPVNRMMGAEEFKDKFFKLYDNTQDATDEIGTNDVCALHELEDVPTNWPIKGQRKKVRSMLDIDTPLESEWDDAKYEKMVVPVVHRSRMGRDSSVPSHFILLTREEALNYDMIQRKVLEKVATFSTWSKLAQGREAESTGTPDADMVLTTASDADSSADGKIAAHSVEGEDDMVDVTMKDANDASTSQQTATEEPQVLRQFNNQRPKFINPDCFLEPELQNLFDLRYFTDGSADNGVPTGWSSTDRFEQLPKLSDRMPQQTAEDDEDEPSPESWNSTASGNDESSNEDDSKTEMGQTRMVEESSEEDSAITSQKFANNRNGGLRGGRKKFKNYRGMGKKANKRREKQMRGNSKTQRSVDVPPQPMPPAVADGGPLVRLGEGLVVEWSDEAWETLFSGQSPAHGSRTFLDVETLNDPSLKMRQRKRKARRTRGITLDECLDEFERAEVLSEQDMWYCPRCKEHRRATKKFDLWKTPDYLVAHLKRFSSTGWRRDKLDVLVDFPIEGLDLTSRVLHKEDGRDEVYDLIAVDDHYGGLGGGHYTAYAKNFVDGRWYNYNDSSVSQVSDPSSAVTSAAYLLFYRRRSSGPLGGPRFAEILEKYNNVEEDDATDSAGEDQRLGAGSSLNGSSGAGTGAAAARLQQDRGSVTTSARALSGPEDDEDLPPYDETLRGGSIRRSVEDEGVEMSDRYPSTSVNMTQPWSFDRIAEDNVADGSNGDCASDSAQIDSSADEREGDDSFFTREADAVAKSAQRDNESWRQDGILSVPPTAGGDRDEDEVAEIHLEK